jgi:hypothetical protein
MRCTQFLVTVCTIHYKPDGSVVINNTSEVKKFTNSTESKQEQKKVEKNLKKRDLSTPEPPELCFSVRYPTGRYFNLENLADNA